MIQDSGAYPKRSDTQMFRIGIGRVSGFQELQA